MPNESTHQGNSPRLKSNINEEYDANEVIRAEKIPRKIIFFFERKDVALIPPNIKKNRRAKPIEKTVRE